MNPFVPHFVVTAEELEALPFGTFTLDVYGKVRGHVCGWPGASLIPSGWAQAGHAHGPISSTMLADGKPLLVLWNPQEPWAVFSAWLSCLDILGEDLEQHADDAHLLPEGSPGQAWFRVLLDRAMTSEVWENPTEAETMMALAGNDFAQCWSKNGAQKQ